MKAITIARQGTPVTGNLAIVDDWEQAEPGAGELAVRTEASALNHLDLWVGMGLPGMPGDFPRIGGSDGCGRVEAVGEGVDEAWIGRRVLLNAAITTPPHAQPGAFPAPDDIHMIGEHEHGTHAEMFVAPAGNVLDVGEADPCEAAAFGLTHLTAWRMMVTRARVMPGQWVLITGIGGGVALAAMNIAQWLGCRTIVTSRHQWKLDRATELGADHCVLDEGEDWTRQVRSITGKRGVDTCVDSVGEAIHGACLKSLARGGTLVTCGCTTGSGGETDLARIFWNQLSVLGSTMGNMTEFQQVVSLFLAGNMAPVIDSIWSSDEADQAWGRLESGEQFGKIVVRWP